jgi:hypothetical protein
MEAAPRMPFQETIRLPDPLTGCTICIKCAKMNMNLEALRAQITLVERVNMGLEGSGGGSGGSGALNGISNAARGKIKSGKNQTESKGKDLLRKRESVGAERGKGKSQEKRNGKNGLVDSQDSKYNNRATAREERTRLNRSVSEGSHLLSKGRVRNSKELQDGTIQIADNINILRERKKFDTTKSPNKSSIQSSNQSGSVQTKKKKRNLRIETSGMGSALEVPPINGATPTSARIATPTTGNNSRHKTPRKNPPQNQGKAIASANSILQQQNDFHSNVSDDSQISEDQNDNVNDVPPEQSQNLSTNSNKALKSGAPNLQSYALHPYSLPYRMAMPQARAPIEDFSLHQPPDVRVSAGTPAQIETIPSSADPSATSSPILKVVATNAVLSSTSSLPPGTAGGAPITSIADASPIATVAMTPGTDSAIDAAVLQATLRSGPYRSVAPRTMPRSPASHISAGLSPQSVSRLQRTITPQTNDDERVPRRSVSSPHAGANSANTAYASAGTSSVSKRSSSSIPKSNSRFKNTPVITTNTGFFGEAPPGASVLVPIDSDTVQSQPATATTESTPLGTPTVADAGGNSATESANKSTSSLLRHSGPYRVTASPGTRSLVSQSSLVSQISQGTQRSGSEPATNTAPVGFGGRETTTNITAKSSDSKVFFAETPAEIVASDSPNTDSTESTSHIDILPAIRVSNADAESELSPSSWTKSDAYTSPTVAAAASIAGAASPTSDTNTDTTDTHSKASTGSSVGSSSGLTALRNVGAKALKIFQKATPSNKKLLQLEQRLPGIAKMLKSPRKALAPIRNKAEKNAKLKSSSDTNSDSDHNAKGNSKELGLPTGSNKSNNAGIMKKRKFKNNLGLPKTAAGLASTLFGIKKNFSWKSVSGSQRPLSSPTDSSNSDDCELLIAMLTHTKTIAEAFAVWNKAVNEGASLTESSTTTHLWREQAGKWKPEWRADRELGWRNGGTRDE